MMYLMLMAGGSKKDNDDALTELKPEFVEWINTLNKTSKETAREFGLNFAFKDAGQLAKRLINDSKLLEEAGFTITHEHRKKQKSNVYLIKRMR